MVKLNNMLAYMENVNASLSISYQEDQIVKNIKIYIKEQHE